MILAILIELMNCFHTVILLRWFVEDKNETNAHQWDQNQTVAEWLESQKENESSIVNQNLKILFKNQTVSQIQNSIEVNFILFFIFPHT